MGRCCLVDVLLIGVKFKSRWKDLRRGKRFCNGVFNCGLFFVVVDEESG